MRACIPVEQAGSEINQALLRSFAGERRHYPTNHGRKLETNVAFYFACRGSAEHDQPG